MKKQKINTLDELFNILLECWCKETAYPSSQKDPEYNKDNDPTYGQCAITATLVYDMFGGTIHKIKVDGGGTHYFNKINGNYIDLTSDQFELYNIPVEYEPNQEISREYCGKNAETLKRFNLLKENISHYLSKLKFKITNYISDKLLEKLDITEKGHKDSKETGILYLDIKNKYAF